MRRDDVCTVKEREDVFRILLKFWEFKIWITFGCLEYFSLKLITVTRSRRFVIKVPRGFWHVRHFGSV